jgi:diguanylate cyclase (GGDEF)-like protein
VISLLANVLVLAGVLVLVGALVPARRLIAHLPRGTVRGWWYAISALIVLFAVGYLTYAAVFWNSHSTLLDLTVPGIFFFGACFVLLTTVLSLRTAADLMRIDLLERESLTDPLTAVFNRRYLDRRLDEEVARARRYGLPLAVLMIDIDHFKQVNDRHGHQAGDQVLIAVAQLLAGGLRESDVLSRYGGEEFLIISPQTRRSGAAGLAERLRKRIESHGINVIDEAGGTREIRVTVSIGVSALDDGTDRSEKIVQAADANLYRAKHEGRNRVIAGEPEAPGPMPSR